MTKYDLSYEILNYEKYHKRLDEIVNNKNNKFKVVKHKSLGVTSCGFEIEHYSIGNGPQHVVYMGGAHGNEIISVDYVTQLMRNIALGNGVYEKFEDNVFTIDFIPCQNLEGFYTTTYAIDNVLKDKSEEEVEKFCLDYWSCYKSDDYIVNSLNNVINNFCDKYNLSNIKDKFRMLFWNLYRDKTVFKKDLYKFILNYTSVDKESIKDYVYDEWNKYFKEDYVSTSKKHLNIFDGISIDSIPDIDESHRLLKNKLIKIYENSVFPISSMANFFANSDGVNLNDNNPIFFDIFKDNLKKEIVIYGNLRDNNLVKSVPGPLGMPSKNLDKEFEMSLENKALFRFLENLNKNGNNCVFINCHGTGGLFFLYPFFDKEQEENIKRDFKFYINNRLASEYVKKVGSVYEKITGINSPYKTMSHPNRITGVGDVLRSMYISSFILELSKMGGNPLAPYGDKNGNYYLTMVSNMEANMSLMNTLKELESLYDINYTYYYDDNGRVHYKTYKKS